MQNIKKREREKRINYAKHILLFPIFSPTGTHVLSCVWPESGKPVCSVEDGFYFNYNVTDRLTLEIPSATELLAGDYACCLVSSDHIPVQTCSLIVQGDFFLSFSFLFVSKLPTIHRRSAHLRQVHTKFEEKAGEG